MEHKIETKETYSSQSLLPISEIRNNVVILKNGGLRSLIEIKGINISLLPQEEQESIIYSWQAFLNNLDFPLETVALSRKTNIDDYINKIIENSKKETNELLKYQINDYVNFIFEFVKNYPIRQKFFYIVVPYEPVVVTPSNFLGSLQEMIKKAFSLNREAFPQETIMPEDEFQRNYQQLIVRQDTVLMHLNRMGLEARIVPTEELIQLFYNLYNPDTIDKKINI